MKKIIMLFSILIIITIIIALRNTLMHSRLSKSFKKMDSRENLPFGFHIVPTDIGPQPGYYIWVLGPFEYRDRITEEWGWQE